MVFPNSWDIPQLASVLQSTSCWGVLTPCCTSEGIKTESEVRSPRSHSWLTVEKAVAPKASQCSSPHALFDKRLPWVEDTCAGTSGPR